MSSAHLIGFSIEFSIQTAFLVAALWIMIKLQKLNYHFLGLLGVGALAIGVEMAINYFVGFGLSSIVVITILMVGITKVTGAEHVDVGFTVMVGSALSFAMNLWLLGMLMGDLRVSARDKEEANLAAAMASNYLAHATAPATVTNAPAPTAEELARERARTTADYFSLKAITQSATAPMAMIHSGTKTYTVALGESVPMDTPKGKVIVICKKVMNDKVILSVDGEEITLSFSLGDK